ncbi:MAG: twin-arginine translocase TatA/TatE family subunit [Candidatus Komeilibacteria bacterium]|jgi:sec-independent protein translocase protein TatA|nr:twin-arginine translocase TatA/TatE family subunit [Candidatus Komeilibacteria bacterium]MBT4447126.1 twin-arginine translocase TatA/TatE family subunit [Candidatus Komeilibacteria bacterium]
MFGLGPKELIIVIGVIVLLFGSKTIPQLGENLAEAIRSLRGAFKEPKDRSQ